MTSILLSFIVTFFVCPTISEVSESSVIELNSENFQKSIDDNKFIMVQLYVPWIETYKKFFREYSEVADQLKMEDSQIKLAKIDVSRNSKIAFQHQSGRYPAMKFFRSGHPIHYNGQRNKKDIINWLKLKSNPPSLILLTTVDQAKTFVNENDLVVIGFFLDGNHARATNFLKAVDKLDECEYTFGISNDSDILEAFNVREDIVTVFKSFGERRKDYKLKRFHWKDIVRFIIQNSLPALIDFESRLFPRIANLKKASLYLIISFKIDGYESVKLLARKISEEYGEEIHVVVMDASNEENERFYDNLGVNKDEIPTMRFVTSSMSKKFKSAASEISESNIKQFVIESRKGKSKRINWRLSEEILKDWDKHPVKILVGKSFDDFIEINKYVFLMFHVPWCGDCKKILPIWEELGERFKNSKDISIAKMDADANEVESMVEDRVARFPSLFFYKYTSSNRIRFEGQHTLEGFIKFLKVRGIKVEDDNKEKDEL